MARELAEFTLEDMTILGACLRSFDRPPESLEDVAQNVVTILHEQVHEAESGLPAFALVRFFVTCKYDLLPAELQAMARDRAGEHPLDGDTQCLTLLATIGKEPEWNHRTDSRNHQVIPLCTPDVVLNMPMVVMFVRKFGLTIDAVAKPAQESLAYYPYQPCHVLHIARAKGSPYIPAQDFVEAHGIESVLGFGSVLPNGSIFVIVMFSTSRIPDSVAELFRSIALNVKMPVLQFYNGPIFSAPDPSACPGEPCGLASDVVSHEVRAIAMRQLLEVYEQTVVEQGFKLQVTLQRLRESETRFRRIIESSVIGILILVHGQVVEANETFLRIVGYAREDLPISTNTLIPPEHRDLQARSHDEALATGSSAPIESQYITKDGRCVFVLVGKALLDRAQESIVAFVLDQTNQKHLETEIRQAQKLEAVGRLAAGVAHEINTPIQYVSLNLRFLQDAFTDLGRVISACQEVGLQENPDFPVPASIAEAMASVDLEYLADEIPRAIEQGLEGADRVATIVRAMKEFAHPGSPDKAAVDLNRALQSAVEVSRNEWKYVADVTTEFDPDLPMVMCVQGEINQVFLNLIVNAADAISDAVREGQDSKGTIAITTRREEDFAEIRVSDTGTGIPESIRQRVYDPFFTTKDVGKGSGQGLALARSVVVDKHQGTIRFESNEGQGTTFIVSLPLGETP